MNKRLKLDLNAAVAPKEANVKSVCKSLKKKLQETHPELNVENELVTINNGFQIKCPDWTFDIVRYQKWLRLDILKTGEKQAKFYKTDAPEVRDVVTLFMTRINETLANESTEQPTENEPVKTVSPLRWVSENGVNGTSGFYACLADKQLAHISTCGMIYWMTDDVTTLDRSKINAKASRVYHEWINGYASATDEEKENTYIRPNLTTADSFAMTRDFKNVELREKQPQKYKNYPTYAEWLDTWKHNMFELLKQDGYKYPSDVSTNSNRKDVRTMKTLRFNSNTDTNTSNQYYVWEVKGNGLSAEVYNKIGTCEFTSDVLTKYGRKTFKTSANDIEACLAAMSEEYNIDPISVVRHYRTDNNAEVPVGYRTSTNSNRRNYLRRRLAELNSAKLPVGGASKSEVDNEFMNDVDSILSLSTGDTIDVDTAYLAYNPDTKEMILSDESETTLDSGFVIIGKFTPDNDALAKIAGKEPELLDEETEEVDTGVEDTEVPEPETDRHIPDENEDEDREGNNGII